jgi:hypothetical protein
VIEPDSAKVGAWADGSFELVREAEPYAVRWEAELIPAWRASLDHRP